MAKSEGQTTVISDALNTNTFNDIELRKQAHIHLKNNNSALALELLAKAANLNTEIKAEILNDMGCIHAYGGFHSLATARFTDSLESRENYTAAIFNRGKSYLALKQFQYALNDFFRVAKIEKFYTPVHFKLAETYYNLNNHYQAIQSIVNAIKIFNQSKKELTKDNLEKFTESYNILLKLFYEDEIFITLRSSKEEVLHDAIKIFSSSEELTKDSLEKFIESYNGTVQLDYKKNSTVQVDIKETFYKYDSYIKIKKYYYETIFSEYGQLNAYLNFKIGFCYFSLSQLNDIYKNDEEKNNCLKLSIKYFTKTLSVIKDIFVIYADRATAYLELKDYQKAIEDFEMVLKINPNSDSRIFYNQGLAFEGNKEYDKAIISYNKAIELNPRDLKIYFNKAVVLISQNKFFDAIDVYELILERDPENIEAKNGSLDMQSCIEGGVVRLVRESKKISENDHPLDKFEISDDASDEYIPAIGLFGEAMYSDTSNDETPPLGLSTDI